MNKILSNRKLKSFIFINIGLIGLALSFSFFLSPYGLVTGGIGGIAINVINILKKFGVEISDAQYPLIEFIIMESVNVSLLIVSLFF